jgi:hypothetical protein
MLIDHKWMQTVVAVIALTAAQAYATETEEEDNYYLSQMKAMSQTATPDQQGAPEGGDLLAGSDLKNLAKQDSKILDEEMKPDFKPEISKLKPKL